jgi:hypothetical protein
MKTARQQVIAPRNNYPFGMKVVILVLATLTILVARPAPAGAITIDFEHLPKLPPQPNNFLAAGAMQIYTDPGVFSIGGGVVLGDPNNFLAAFAAHGSSPNLYGTTDIADPSLLPVITLLLPSAEIVLSVTGVLFNGQPIPEDYVVGAFSGGHLVASQPFTGMAADSSPDGFGEFSLGSDATRPITSMTFSTPNASLNGWDFFVDTIELTVASGVPIPEPGTALPFLMGALGLLIVLRRPRIW